VQSSPKQRARQIAKELQQTAKQTEQLASEHVRLARKLHRQGHESDEQLAQAEYIAKRVTQDAMYVQKVAKQVKQRKAKPQA
jgi:DNA repair protein RadC